MPASQNRMKLHRRLLCALLFCPLLVRAAIIGTNVPATPLTAERAASLPAWKIYFENSTRQRQADQDFLRAELKAHGLKQSTLPHKMNSAKGLALDRATDWYGGDEARRIADILRSFQTPAGGWSKNTDFTQHVRAPGEMFGVENGSLWLAPTILTSRRMQAGATSARSTTTRRRPSCAFWRRSFRRTPRTASRGARRFRAGWVTFSPHNFRTAAGRRSGRCRAAITTR